MSKISHLRDIIEEKFGRCFFVLDGFNIPNNLPPPDKVNVLLCGQSRNVCVREMLIKLLNAGYNARIDDSSTF